MADGVHRLRAQGRALELRALLLGRGRRRRRPLALRRRGAAGGAEVLPDDPAGRRGTPRRLLQPLHEGGRRARRRVGRRSLRAIKPQLTWGFEKVFGRLEKMCEELRKDPSIPQLAAGGSALPRGDRGDARPAGPALHHQLPRGPRHPARLPRGDAERRRRRAAPHRLRRQAAQRPAQDGPRGPPRRRRPAARGHAVDDQRARAAGLGRALHRDLRLLDGGPRRGGRDVDGDEDAQRRHAARGAARPAGDADGGHAARAGDPRQARSARPATSARRPGRRRASRRTSSCCSSRSPTGSTPRPRARPARSSGTSSTTSPGT